VRPDHLDYYKGGLPEIIEAFRTFTTCTYQRNGWLIACADDEVVAKNFLSHSPDRVISYGLYSGEWQAQCLEKEKKGYSFLVRKSNAHYGKFRIGLPGLHNVQNALAAIVLADFLGIDRVTIDRGLGDYQGVHRRYEKRFVSDSVVIIDDYGHVPQEISAVLAAIRQEFLGWPILCVPCLRQFHRTFQRLEEFSSVLATAEVCVVAPIVAGLGDDDTTKQLLTSKDVAAAVIAKGGKATAGMSEDEVAQRILEMVNRAHLKPCVILLIGSGVSENIITALRSNFL
jgi:UDP-N-acetylmuramate--alanine ligase